VVRREIWQERTDRTQRIQWLMPGSVWSVDPTEMLRDHTGWRDKLHLLPVQDLSSRYKFAPRLRTGCFDGPTVAAHLERLFQQYGAPLVLKRDWGSNLNDAAVDEALSRYWVIPLNSPPHYPPYNGGMERAQRELKAALRALLPDDEINEVPWEGLAALAVHELNHRPRRSLRRQTACEQFAGAKFNLRGYTRRVRKEAFDQITASAMKMIHDNVVRTQLTADAAWRRAVETWLQTEELITLVQPKTVTRFP
jgi:transposase InsO family protein